LFGELNLINLPNFVTHLGFSNFIKVVALANVMIKVEDANAFLNISQP
jgi:phosphatidylserine decarboxylase